MKNKKKYNFIIVLIAILTYFYFWHRNGNVEKYSTQKETQESVFAEVLNHFEYKDPHIQKQKAARYLFDNMQNCSSYYDIDLDSQITFVADTFINQQTRTTSNYFLEKYRTFRKKKGVVLLDKKHLSKDFLIKHINITFDNWIRLSKVSGTSFKDYCDYILPYRLQNEPINEISTDYFNIKYKWIADSLLNNVFIDSVMHEVIEICQFQPVLYLKPRYPFLFSAIQTHHLKRGESCASGVVYFVSFLRSIGIPAAMDYVPQWGNHHFNGHSWLSVKWQGRWHCYDITKNFDLKALYNAESIPKVYRSSFPYSTLEDVTHEYKNTVDLKIRKATKDYFNGFTPAVAIFNKYDTYRIISVGKDYYLWTSFSKLGSNVIYFPGYIRNQIFVPNSAPIYVDSLGQKEILKPDKSKLISIKLHRKYPISWKRSRTKLDYIASLNHCRLEGSDDRRFTKLDTLIDISGFSNPLEKEFVCHNCKKYRYVRLVSDQKAYVAELKLFGQNHQLLNGFFFPESIQEKAKLIHDNNTLTFFRVQNRFVGYDFGKPQQISSLSIQPRNDGNHIEIGDDYELIIWDEGWKRFAHKRAKNNFLEFENVPSNGLFWLKNITKGSEELPFIILNNGQQFWPGQG
ncbi:MAG: hypothetical protein N4A74_19870 [Carboxylicivirga sp.]|jgi:hypothetical protein|nr:hypothetical protein [Carboxylicivirga sp.]